MLWKHVFLIGLLSLTVSLVHAQDNATACVPAAGDVLHIGAVFPSQTVLMASAITPYQGVVAMVDAVNACGGIAGHPLELVSVPANNRDSAREAVAKLSGDVPLIIGSGLPAVSEVLLDASHDGKFVYWEVTEPLDKPHQWSFSPLPNNAQLGSQSANFIQSRVSTLLADKPLRLAIIYQKRPAAQQIVDALASDLPTVPVLTYAYDNVLYDGESVAQQIREKKINALVVVGFDHDTDNFWLSMRQTDANVLAYIQVSAEPDRSNWCEHVGNTDGLITVSRTGAVNPAYRQQHIGALYDQYLTAYKEKSAAVPDESADLAASGTYLLLHDILPLAADDFTVANLQRTLTTLQLSTGHGLMGEGFAVDGKSLLNGAGIAIFQQRQDNQFCSLAPSDIATCSSDLQPFPTWRERVSQPQFASCID
ncbi:MAG: ABC transporter substrate-binding protein [Anaerolineae bacterium]|nr:ABC transporter substrate-binding protein [Anaerolineae bacterium]